MPKASGGGEIPSFTFQFEEPRCRGVLISSLKSLEPVRSVWSLAVINANGGGDIGSAMQRMPEIPGINVIVQHKERRVIFEDPLEKNTDLLDTINGIVEDTTAIAPSGGRTFKHAPRKEREMTDDEFITFLLEILYYDSDKSDMNLRLIKGTLPTRDKVDKIPGRELFDVRSNSHIQPKYVDQVGEYHEKLIFGGNG